MPTFSTNIFKRCLFEKDVKKMHRFVYNKPPHNGHQFICILHTDWSFNVLIVMMSLVWITRNITINNLNIICIELVKVFKKLRFENR